jgi:hypothetical protein
MLRFMIQPVACTLGMHDTPPSRQPPGPVVATCPCCGKVIYYYGLSASMGVYPSLLLPNFPKVLGALPPAQATSVGRIAAS